ncbi:patatin-like phospholipase family protein [Solirubrobacter sp. CPCC 204708]|uniref:Patatin-like phospholipase family protein n=1 Tax=Solirubrobacter deserti TaxID=2282478 RepID=A0ABT4RV99_9ACTN|nr:patatin-like phospholipase family protein [Solirubrobacter deserti]MBE2318915.1 patatin-like phospholipase family protein [Solirubrobacter deserti]MDA0142509.1 patatin-like phospholipase family protein [Solirubrobacter deserti]
MRIGLVLPGGGARGAYEAGALSVLLPALEARGERVEVVCGTSVGGINAAVVAAVAARPAREQALTLLEHWRSVRKGFVIRPVIGVGTGLGLVRLVGELLELAGLRAASLLDPSPLARSLDGWIDWDALHANVAARLIHAVCVVATSVERGLPVGFVESAAAPPRGDREIDYVHTRLEGQHVRASAAIPLLFPPVEVTAPLGAVGHYVDGATRLNAPIAPALALGAERVIVVGYEPFAAERGRSAGAAPAPRVPGPALSPPRLADVAANALDGLLLDQVAHDVRRMLAVNAFFAEHPTTGTSRAARAYREAQGRPPYRRVSYALVAPSRRGEIGALAEAVFRERYGGLRGLRSPDFALLSRVLGGGAAAARGELLSFIFFDEVFIERLLKLGREDAQRWLDAHPSLWSADAAAVGFEAPAVSAEAVALDEFRARRR